MHQGPPEACEDTDGWAPSLSSFSASGCCGWGQRMCTSNTCPSDGASCLETRLREPGSFWQRKTPGGEPPRSIWYVWMPLPSLEVPGPLPLSFPFLLGVSFPLSPCLDIFISFPLFTFYFDLSYPPFSYSCVLVSNPIFHPFFPPRAHLKMRGSFPARINLRLGSQQWTGSQRDTPPPGWKTGQDLTPWQEEGRAIVRAVSEREATNFVQSIQWQKLFSFCI